jgi:tetratricopeptide (TPR) repeat protein
MRAIRVTVPAFVAALLVGQAISQTVVTAVTNAALEKGVGHELRPRSEKAEMLLREKKYAEAKDEMEAVLGHFEKMMSDPETVYRSFANADELEYFKKRNPDIKKVVWLDHAFGSALHQKAFYHADQKQWDLALKALDREAIYRPFAANTQTERGFVLNQTGKPKDALAAYQTALTLSEKLAHARPYQAMALRGIGYSHIELGDLPAARAAYERSLKIDPNSAVAKRELEYILKLESKKK